MFYGDGKVALVVAPEDLPECGIPEIDCEGAEHIILAGIIIRLRAIGVETHRIYGSPTKAVHKAFEKIGCIVTTWVPPSLIGQRPVSSSA
jgi:hypothetical protein